MLQAERLQIEEELCRLRSQVELQRMQASVIATLEGERAMLERERETLRSSVDTLRTAQRKVALLQYTHYALQNTHTLLPTERSGLDYTMSLNTVILNATLLARVTNWS